MHRAAASLRSSLRSGADSAARARSSISSSVVLPHAGQVRAKSSHAVAAPQKEAMAFTYKTPAFKKTDYTDLIDNWDGLGFSIRTLNGHMRYQWRNGVWGEGVFVPAPYQLMHINSGALHYGISAFEGLKAFHQKDGIIRCMNPKANAARMAEGARKLRMPEPPEEMFLEAITEAIKRNIEFVPPYGTAGTSIYVRPLLFASGPMLSLNNLAEEYTLMVTVMPAAGYFSKADPNAAEQGAKAIVFEDHDRAAPRGLGHTKCAGNYAADLDPVHRAKALGYTTTLYLDSEQQKYVDEFSVCNFVGITHDGTYVTPNATTILKGTTNRMMRQLAKDRGMKVEERPINFHEEIGSFKEVGMVGTAAVVVKCQSITRGDKTWEFPEFENLAALRTELMGIQTGDIPDRHGWMSEICEAYHPPVTK